MSYTFSHALHFKWEEVNDVTRTLPQSQKTWDGGSVETTLLFILKDLDMLPSPSPCMRFTSNTTVAAWTSVPLNFQ